VRRARFPFLKTIDDFNFIHQSTVRLSLLGSALAPEFVSEGRCLILSGKPGRGKTHLAVAMAYRAIQNGFDALFVTAAELIDDLSAAFRSGRLADALAAYIQPGVLIVDEVGYLTYPTAAWTAHQLREAFPWDEAPPYLTTIAITRSTACGPRRWGLRKCSRPRTRLGKIHSSSDLLDLLVASVSIT
jgi:hypothetical protein